MRVPLETLVPYDKSLQWRIHDAYFATRGIAAWTQGSIPFRPTSNFAFARQSALLLAKVARELEAAGRLGPRDPVHILEIGAGLGHFSLHVFRALETMCGPLGKSVAARLRYVLSDYSEANVRQSTEAPALRDLVSEGRLVPALFDLRVPGRLLDLERKPVDTRFLGVVSNYVCCVTPLKVVRKKGARFEERWARVEAEIPDGEVPPSAEILVEAILSGPRNGKPLPELKTEGEWRPCDLDALFGDPFHAALIREALLPFEDATIAYPYTYVDFVRALGARMVEGGVLLVSDYGYCEPSAWRGLQDAVAQRYGETLNHTVNFALFDALCPRLGLALERTDNSLLALHTAAIRFAPEVPASFHRVFQNTLVRHEDGEDFMVFLDAGRAAQEKNDHVRAARLYEHALALDPENVDILMRAGTACTDAKCPKRALDLLERGQACDRARAYDFDFAIGRAYFGLGRLDEAIERYRLSNAVREDAAAFTNIGAIYEEKKDWKRAYHHYHEALRVKPDYERAKTLLAELMQKWCDLTLADGNGADEAP